MKCRLGILYEAGLARVSIRFRVQEIIHVKLHTKYTGLFNVSEGE